MSTATSFDLGGGGNSFEFSAPGSSVTGRIVDIEQVQQTDMQTGQPAVWDNGEPKMMVRVELATDSREDSFDDGKRSVYLKGSRKPESMSSMAAVLAAVQKATGGRNLTLGGTLTLTYSGDGEAPRKGWNAPKHYTAVYVPAAVSLGDDPASAVTASAPAADDTPPTGFTAEQWAGMPEATKAAIRAAQQ
ncbi:hypothetical protein [uncultured Gordonia sp.]|uniref:hypothetical protein n=1 Tax=uncultured Gordonia sp. TaxID=198437 RepID=UPI00258B4225|nr:hypothetical protein [uncultured Gordonia sp.]